MLFKMINCSFYIILKRKKICYDDCLVWLGGSNGPDREEKGAYQNRLHLRRCIRDGRGSFVSSEVAYRGITGPCFFFVIVVFVF